MEQGIVDSVAMAGSVGAADLTIWNLFFSAHWVVKLVMICLLLASIWSWAIIFDKSWRLRRLDQRASRFEDAFWSGGSLDDLYERVGPRPVDPMSPVFSAAMRAWRRSAAKGRLPNLSGRAGMPGRHQRAMTLTPAR